MRRTLGALPLALTLMLAACGSDEPEHADERTGGHASSTPTPSGTGSAEPSDPGDGPLADLAVQSLGTHPCADARKAAIDAAISSGGAWMPTAEPALMDDLEQAWSCARDLPALQWPDLTILFLPEAPQGSPRAFFEAAADDLGRGSVESALGSPALVLEPEGDQPAEVEVVMGATHIVLIGTGEISGEELLAVAESMAPLH